MCNKIKQPSNQKKPQKNPKQKQKQTNPKNIALTTEKICFGSIKCHDIKKINPVPIRNKKGYLFTFDIFK